MTENNKDNPISNKSFDFSVRIIKTDFINRKEFDSLEKDIQEIIKILTSILMTTKQNIN